MGKISAAAGVSAFEDARHVLDQRSAGLSVSSDRLDIVAILFKDTDDRGRETSHTPPAVAVAGDRQA
jgi:hypothetical protein